mmetsp:Transcript_76872/g.135420  ORF Transcript_76872/g.135420 Transcript_76872/m.135420 type:complete len:740 (+) Transcript_76872:50-2269(+)
MAEEKEWDPEVWHFKPFPMGTLNPPPLLAKPNLKTLEEELHRQAQHCHDKLQKDMDSLHAQVLSEVHRAVAQELAGAAHKIASVQSESKADVEALRATVSQLCEEAKYVRSWRDEDRAANKEANARVAEQASAEVAALREEMHAIESSLKEQMQKIDQAAEHRAQELESSLGRQIEEAVRAGMQDFTAPESNKENEEEAAKLGTLQEQLQAEIQERERFADAARAAEAAARDHLVQLQEAVKSQVAIGEARWQESQASVVGLEQRQAKDIDNVETRLTARVDVLDEMLTGTRHSSTGIEDKLADLGRMIEDRANRAASDLHHFSTECRQELAFAHSNWARLLDWAAEVDLEQLEKQGKLDITSPIFSAAGLRSLQLHLRLQVQVSRNGEESRPRRWTVGAFLQSPTGQVSFRLHVGGKSVSFAAEFGQAAEWGSQRLVVLDSLEQTLNVRLEILDVTAPISHVSAYPSSMTVAMRTQDAAQAAAREASSFRSSMVRKIEWRITRVSERVAAAKAASNSIGNDEALEPIVSPPFAAGGFEGMQLHLYPLGYRPKGEDMMCGFFLLCPKGMYVKCRAFIGDAVRNWDHVFEEREPYGRGSFCRLADKADSDDSVVCGVELLEIRMEHTSQVRHGPFGSVGDQLKLVSQPSIGSMEMVRELKELSPMEKDRHPAGRGGRSRKPGHGHGGHGDRNAAKQLTPAGSKSSPVLLPHLQPGGAIVAAEPVPLPFSPSGGYGNSNWR